MGTLRGTHMGTLSGTHFSVPLRKLLPFGQVHIFRSVPLRDILFFAGSFGPSNAPTSGAYGYPYGTPMFKIKIMDLNQYLDRMNTKTIII